MSTWLTLIFEPFTYPFMLKAFLAATLIGVVCAIFSCFLILKGWSLMGDALSHAVLPGIVVAFVLQIPLIIGAFVSGLCCTLASGYIRDHCRVKEDSVMGIVFSGMFALGLVLFTYVDTDQHLSHILFGNVLGTTHEQLLQIALITLSVSTVVLVKRKDLMLYCFDPAQARVAGLRVNVLHYGLLALLALTIVVSLQAAGIILVVAMLIAPGITGFILTKNFAHMLIIALSVSVSACIVGTLISFYIDAATGPLIVAIQALFFVIAQINVSLHTQKTKIKILENATN